jgi:hypothetical protein
MGLIKCSECGADISTEAVMCPHCGKPNTAHKTEVPREETKTRPIGAALSVFIVPLFGFIVWSLLAKGPSISLEATHGIVPATQLQANPGTEVPLQEVRNLGYDFYLGQIEEPGVNDVNDDVKNQITQVVYETHFPESLLKNTPIIILNNLALTGDQYILVGRARLQAPELKADFLSEGGVRALRDEHGRDLHQQIHSDSRPVDRRLGA